MISVHIDGDTRRLLRRINHMADIDKKAVNGALASAMRTSTRQRFRTQKSPEGKQWKDSIRVSQHGGLTLSDTGRLKNSIRSRANISGFAVGTNVIYARTHQLGENGRTITAKTSSGLRFRGINGNWVNKKNVRIVIPARPFLGFSEEDYAEIKATLNDVLSED